MSEVDILVEAEGWKEISSLESTIRGAVGAALAAAGKSTATVSLLLSDDAAIRHLNLSYRGQDKPTNVLSFPSTAMPGNPAPFLGDIALAYETCISEAEAEGKTLSHHLTHLVIHGTLHLLGYDHETDGEAETMEALEARILAGLGIANPYTEAATASGARGFAQ